MAGAPMFDMSGQFSRPPPPIRPLIETQASPSTEVHNQSASGAVTECSTPACFPLVHFPAVAQAQNAANVQVVVEAQAIAEAQDVAQKADAQAAVQLGRAQGQAQVLAPQGPLIGAFLTSVPPPNYRYVYNGEPCYQPQHLCNYSPSVTSQTLFYTWHRLVPPPGYAPQNLYEVAHGYNRAPHPPYYANSYYGEAQRYNAHIHHLGVQGYEAFRARNRNLEVSTGRLVEPLHYNIVPCYCNCPCRIIPPTHYTQYQPIGYYGNWTNPMSSHGYESDLDGTEGSIEDYVSPYYSMPLSPRYRQTSQSSHGYDSEPPTMTRWSLGYNADEMPPNAINNNKRYGAIPKQRTRVAGPCCCAGFCHGPAVPPAFRALPALQALHSVPEPPEPVALPAIPKRQTPAAQPARPNPAFSVPPPPLPPTTRTPTVPKARDPSQFLPSRAGDVAMPSPVNNTQYVPVVSANREVKLKGIVTSNIKPFTRYKKMACRPPRPSAPINFAPPPVSTVDTQNKDRPRYYSEVASGVPRRTQAQNLPRTKNQNIPTASAIGTDPWPNRNKLIPGAATTSRVPTNSEIYEADTTRGIRFGAIGDGIPKTLRKYLYYYK